MVSFKETTKPLNPIVTDEKQKAAFDCAMLFFISKRFLKAARAFKETSKLYDSSSSKSRASADAMMANYYMMQARRAGEKNPRTRESLENVIKFIGSALENEPYWATYLERNAKLKKYIHETFGCRVSREGSVWTTSCYKVSKALGLPGLSPGWTLRLECSICGKDPIDCKHIPGNVYNGRKALMVAKDIEPDHVAIVDEPMQLETYILPRPLSIDDLKRILPPKLAADVIAGRRELSCKDLLKAIRKHSLSGIYWRTRE